MAIVSTCYMCDSLETSREHAPPRCFSPESKEMGRNLRVNLITVRSCYIHNSEKSKDEEFLRSDILMSENGNDAGRHLFLGKLLRAVRRPPFIYGSFLKDKRLVVQGRGRALKFNHSRFDACIDNIARALFFDMYMFKWQLTISIVSPNFFSRVEHGRVVPHQKSIGLIGLSRMLLQNEPVLGGNPKVCKYRLRYDDNTKCFALSAIFYESFEIYTFSSLAFATSISRSCKMVYLQPIRLDEYCDRLLSCNWRVTFFCLVKRR